MLRGKRLLLFLGRVHFKKGLDLLVPAWGEIAQNWPDAHLVIAGPDSENSQAAVENLVRQGKMEDRVTFTGMLRGEMKWSALAAAHCFVLPSYSEGLSTSVLEAMGAGLPVIVTRQCNLPDVVTYKAGWQIESNLAELTYTLGQALHFSSEQVQEMGARGRELVLRRYNWNQVAKQMCEVYEWIVNGSTPTHLEVQTVKS